MITIIENEKDLFETFGKPIPKKEYEKDLEIITFNILYNWKESNIWFRRVE